MSTDLSIPGSVGDIEPGVRVGRARKKEQEETGTRFRKVLEKEAGRNRMKGAGKA